MHGDETLLFVFLLLLLCFCLPMNVWTLVIEFNWGWGGTINQHLYNALSPLIKEPYGDAPSSGNHSILFKFSFSLRENVMKNSFKITKIYLYVSFKLFFFYFI